jgi:hypothetical protein
MQEHGDFSATKPHWNAQTRLEKELLEFCSLRFGNEPGRTQLWAHIANWLSVWREKKK